MFHNMAYTGSREQNYKVLIEQLHTLLEGEQDVIANLSNASALLNQFLEDVNWVGFYLLRGEELVLGPFQGLPACIRIPLSRGVCGAAARERRTILVEDVHSFPGHIACDAASRSEIVIPMVKKGELVGVLDIDSPSLARFDETDRQYLEKYVDELLTHLQEGM